MVHFHRRPATIASLPRHIVQKCARCATEAAQAARFGGASQRKRIDLLNEPVMLKDRALRLRRLVIKPGGIVPWYSHTNRPAIIYIITGTIAQYRSTCKMPIVHRAGEATAEVKGMSHWLMILRKPSQGFAKAPTVSQTPTSLMLVGTQ
jgi:quercetin dioxygenase-like cupin family protein